MSEFPFNAGKLICAYQDTFIYKTDTKKDAVTEELEKFF